MADQLAVAASQASRGNATSSWSLRAKLAEAMRKEQGRHCTFHPFRIAASANKNKPKKNEEKEEAVEVRLLRKVSLG